MKTQQLLPPQERFGLSASQGRQPSSLYAVLPATLVIFLLSLVPSVKSFLLPCTKDAAAIDGQFSCSSPCDDEHIHEGVKYCLSYYPNGGQCYMRPMTPDDILTCNGKQGRSDPNRWYVSIGGSNAWTEFVQFIDVMLAFPKDTPYSPQNKWGAGPEVSTDAEMGFMDFIWDADHQLVSKFTYGLGNPLCDDCDYYDLHGDMEKIFDDVPVVEIGGFRASYASLHFVAQFPDRFDRIVGKGSAWLATNPIIDARMEWTGFWGDWDVNEAGQAENLKHLNKRQDEEGLIINSYIVNDSAGDCGMGRYDNAQSVVDAMKNTPASYKKVYWSKRDMTYAESLLTGYCATDGHSEHPMTIVFMIRYWNMLCGEDEESFDDFTEEIPTCFNIDDSLDNCFFHDGAWLGNLRKVCPFSWDLIPNPSSEDFCVYATIQTADKKLPVCVPILEPEPIVSPAMDPLTFDSLLGAATAICIIYTVVSPYCKRKGAAEGTSKAHNAPLGRPPSSMNAATAAGPDKSRVAGEAEMVTTATPQLLLGDSVSSKEALSPTDAAAVRVKLRSPAQSIVAVAPGPQSEIELVGRSDDEINDENSGKPGIGSPNFLQVAPTARMFCWRSPEEIEISAIAMKADSGKFDALLFGRYLASIHIVLGHMYQAGHLTRGGGFNAFGFTWVPWFFLLSGFVLTFAEARRRSKLPAGGESSRDPPIFDYVVRRLESLYPAYVLGIISAVITAWNIKGPSSLQSPSDILISLCLLQSWIPSILEDGLIYLVQCWFLSCLFFYWILFYRIFQVVHNLSDLFVVLLSAFCSVAIPTVYQLATFKYASVFDEHVYMSENKAVDALTVSLKYHPLAYLHIFVLGCCLPRIREIILARKTMKCLIPYTSSVGYLFIFALYCTDASSDIPGYKLSLRLGLFSVFQSMILIGLCNAPQDILGKIFLHPVLVKIGSYSFPQYVFQFLVYAWFKQATGKNQVDFRYFLLLFTASVFVSLVAERINGKKMHRVLLGLAPFLVLFLILQPFLSSSHRRTPPSMATPAAAVSALIPPSWVNDTIMNFAVSSDAFMVGPPSDRHIFNPSLHLSGASKMFAVRRDHVTTKSNYWFGHSYSTNAWTTEVLIGLFNAESRRLSAMVVDTGIVPCMRPLTCNSNGTLTAKVISGPEDPRVFHFRGSYYLSLFSYDQVSRPGVHSDDYLGVFGTGTDYCTPTWDGLIGRMYITELSPGVPINKCVLGPILPVLQDSFIFPRYSIVKNWLAFTYFEVNLRDQPDAEILLFIHQISPNFVIMRVTELATDHVMTTTAYNTTTPKDILELDHNARSYGKSDEDLKVLDETGRRSLFLSHDRAQKVRELAAKSVDPLARYACPDGYDLGPGPTCVKLVVQSKNFYDARDSCSADGGQMMKVDSQELDEFLADSANSAQISDVWIGLNDIDNEGSFVWSDGESATYERWSPGEPNDSGGDEDCAELLGDGQWNDANCWTEFPFFCQVDFIALAPIRNETLTNPSYVHGSANPVLISADQSSSGEAYYVSIFHTVGNDASVNYASYAFTFCSEPPFQISGVSSQLWLNISSSTANCNDEPFAFVSGLAVDTCFDGESDCIFISYGVCDKESRVSKYLLADFESAFTSVLGEGERCAERGTASPTVSPTPAPTVSPTPPPTKPPPPTRPKNGGCHDGYTFIEDSCFKAVYEYKSWDDSQEYCKADLGDLGETLNGGLASIRSETVNWLLWNQIGIQDNVWIGYRTDGVSWTWARAPLAGSYESWDWGQPDGSGNCAYFWWSDLWDDTDCGAEFYFVCEHDPMWCPEEGYFFVGDGNILCARRSEEGGEAEAACVREGSSWDAQWNSDTASYDFFCKQGPRRCPSGYSRFEDSCYRFEGKYDASWYDASSKCSEECYGQGFLVDIDSQQANDFVSDLVGYDGVSAFIGFSDAVTEGHWEWSEGGNTNYYTNWAGGQPDGGVDENVAFILPDGCNNWDAPNVCNSWYDAPSSLSSFYVCQSYSFQLPMREIVVDPIIIVDDPSPTIIRNNDGPTR